MPKEEERNEHALVLRPEFPPFLLRSSSIWGELDILNSIETSQATLTRVKELVDETGLNEGIYLGLKQVFTPEEYRLPLVVFDTNPEELELDLDEWVTFVSGPLVYNEAIAAGYLLETAEIVRNIFEGALELEEAEMSLAFKEIAERIGGQRRFVPLGVMTIYDYIARMAHYRHVKDDLEKLGMSEDSDLDLARIVADPRIVPLAKAFREDGYQIGDNFQQTIDTDYIGNTNLFIPFAGLLNGYPETKEDWQMLGLGMYTGVRLFRLIENEFSTLSS